MEHHRARSIRIAEVDVVQPLWLWLSRLGFLVSALSNCLGAGQTMFAPDLRLGLAAALRLGLGGKRRHRTWLTVLIEGDEHQISGGGVGALGAGDILGLHPHPDLQRGPTD